MPLKYTDKGDEPLQSGYPHNFKELKSSGIDNKRPLEFKAQVIPCEGYEDTDSPILAFSGNNINFIFNIPREHFRKLAAAVLDHMDNDLAKSEVPNSFGPSNASKNGSTSEITKECNFNLKDSDTDNPTEIPDAYKEECTSCVPEDLPNVTQAESETRIDSESNRRENFSDEFSSFGCKIGKSVKNDSSDNTNSRSTTAVLTMDHDILHRNNISKKNHYSMNVHLDEVKCTEDSTSEFRESLSKGENEVKCSESNDITEDIKVLEVDPEHGVNIKMASNENLATDVQNESMNLGSDNDSINKRNNNIDIIDANLSAHTSNASFENCQDIERSWPDMHPFTENEVIPLTEIKSCESAGVRMKYFKLELVHELMVLKVSLEGNGISVEAARYKTNTNSATETSKDCSEELIMDECREADKTVSIEKEKSMDKSESKIYKKSTDLSNREDKTETNDVEIVLQLEDKINNPIINPIESVKKNTDMLEAIANTGSCVSQSKHSYKEYEDQSMKQSENKNDLESPSMKKVESLTENVDVSVVENFQRYGTVKVHEIGQMEENSSEDISTNEAEGEISQNGVSTKDIEKIQSTEIIDHQKELMMENTKEEISPVNLTNEVGDSEISEHAVSTEHIEKIQSAEIIGSQKELMLENIYSEKFSLEKLAISKDESFISENEMDEKDVAKRSIASKMQLEESSAETYSSEDVSSNAVTLQIDSVEVSPIRLSRKYLYPDNIKSPHRNAESAITSSVVEKEKPVYVSVSTPRNKPQQNDSGEGLQATNESNSEINSSSLKFTPVHCTIKGSDSKGSVASSEAEIVASDQPGQLIENESGNLPELQAANVPCYEAENKTECSACDDLNDTNHLDTVKKPFQSLPDENAGNISENKAIQEIERDSKLFKLTTEDAEKQGDKKGFTNELAENLESGTVSKFIPDEEKAEDISVGSKLSEISFLKGAEQVSDEDKKEPSFTNSLTVNLESGVMNETVKGDTSKNNSFLESEISEDIPTECTEEQSREDGNGIKNKLTEDLKSESVGQTVLEEEETETVENISAECLEDIVEEVENESLRNASKDKDEFSANSSGNELEKTLVDNCDVKDEIEKINGIKEKMVIGKVNDNAVNDSCTSESDLLTGPASSVTLDDRSSLQTSCLKSFSDIDNTKDLGNVIPNKSFESETKSSDLVMEDGTAKSVDNIREEYPQDSVSNKTTPNESVDGRTKKFENSLSDAKVVKAIQDFNENGIENLREEKTIDAGAESTSEVDILESDDSKSIASESDDSRDSEKSASKRKAGTNKSKYDETDCAPTRVRTRKAPSGLSEDVIPENSAVTRGAKSSKVHSFTTDRSLKPTGKVSPNARSLRSKSLDPSPQSSKVSSRDKKYGTVAEAEEVARRKRAVTPEVIKKDIKAAVRSSPRKLTRANSANPESSSSSKVQSTRSGSEDSRVKARPNLETSVSRRPKRGQ